MDDFFDSNELTAEPVAESTPAPPPRPPGRQREPVHPEERRRLMVRRAIALGIGLVILLLLVLGVKGCLDSRKNRSLDEYAGNVTQVVDETNALGKSMFDMLADPGELSVTDFTGEIETDRNAMDGFLARVEKLDVPGDMRSAQQDLVLSYQLRSDAMGEIAAKMPTALGDEGSEKAVQAIAGQVQVLTAADVLYNRVTRHKIDGVIESAGAGAAELPVAQFVPRARYWSDPGNIESALASVSGASTQAADGAIHGTGLSSVAIGGVALAPSVANTVPAGTEPVVEVSVQNQGEAEETDVEVSVSVDGGSAVTETIPILGVGETGIASITLTPAPTGEVTIDVSVAGVDGEALLDNNEASYTVTFE